MTFGSTCISPHAHYRTREDYALVTVIEIRSAHDQVWRGITVTDVTTACKVPIRGLLHNSAELQNARKFTFKLHRIKYCIPRIFNLYLYYIGPFSTGYILIYINVIFHKTTDKLLRICL
jgi:hypothetical protein